MAGYGGHGGYGYSGYGQVDGASGSGLSGFLHRLGERAVRRPEPRFGIGLGGVGMLMILVGILAWAGESAAESDEGSTDTTLGIVLSVAVIIAGYVLLLRFRGGPLAAAGVVASALGVPVLVGFATFDPASVDPDAFFDLPMSIDAMAILSLVAWIAAYGWIPVAQGRAVYLGLSAFVLWLYVVETIEDGALGYLLTLPFSAVALSFASAFDEFDRELPDPATIGWVSLVFGIAYYAVAVWLDRKGLRGSATPFVAAGAVASVVGLIHLAGELDVAGTGVLLVLLGSVLAIAAGATQGRRFTTWGWCFGIGLGLVLIIGESTEESAAVFGMSAILVGIAVIVVSHVVSSGLDEPDELTPGPSRFRSRTTPPVPGQSPWAPQPGYGPAAGIPGIPPPGYQYPPPPPVPPPPGTPPPGTNQF